jgi:hypothetical protein
MWLYLAASATGYKDSEVFAAAMPENKRWREIHAAKPPNRVIVGMAAFNGYVHACVHNGFKNNKCTPSFWQQVNALYAGTFYA